MNPIVFAIPVFMASILLEVWVARRRGLKAYDAADALTSLHLGVLSQITGLFAKLATLGIYVAVFEQYRLATLPISSVWVWAGALLAYDFCYYWAHRMGHEVGVLWAAHVVHHSSEYYNLSTALRQTSSGWLFGWIFYLPMALAGVPPIVMVGVGLIDLLYQYWVHTEMVGRLGWLDRVFVTPSNHRVHHGQNDYCIDRNYGGILILWDRWFGTFADERDDEKIIYGVRSPLRSLNPLWANVHYYADLWRCTGQARGLRKKMHVWLGAPGAWTGETLAHFDGAQFQPYRPNTPPPAVPYCVLQFALLAPCIMHLIAVGPSLPAVSLVLYAVLIVAGTLGLGALLEGRRLGARIEQARGAFMGLAFALLPDWFGYEAPLPLRAAVLVLALGAAVWLEKNIKTHQWETA
ncbi:sterol desaturase family protein [Duganella sp. BuS-21]|uniref:sterol desaturase family protein n=1 Tax=Duganella sp. BuS-21 TaxID=2943848 RepID=UPI0035A69E58